VRPGDTLSAGYAFSLPGKHAAATITFNQAQAIVQATCLPHRQRHHHHHDCRRERSAGPLFINIADASYSAAANSSAWVPSANDSDPSVFQGSIVVPDLCDGEAFRVGGDATFTSMVGSQ
jgi:hypothetical protein